jgi:hypothetical protein
MTVTRGFYKHYRGDVYFVEGVGVTHDDDHRIVVYHSTESAKELSGIRLRFEDDFEMLVDPMTGEAPDQTRIASAKPRFERIESKR